MDAITEAYWSEVLQRLGLNVHPKRLTEHDQKLQFFLLNALSADPMFLPREQLAWEEWFNWHDQYETEETP